ncbi:MAG: histidinol dehydrogenase [Sedimentisphaerales bacterium]
MTNELDKILIKYDQPDFEKRFTEIRTAVVQVTHFEFDSEKEEQLDAILDDVSKRGDEAVAEYTEKFDGVKLTPEQFRISEAELNDAHKAIDKKLLKSIRQAIKNVKEYQSKIFVGKNKSFKSTGIKYTPIKRVGICVPGASAPLPSTVIMTAVPAQVAGVKEIVVVSPPRYNGSIHPVILATCQELKIKEVYRIGGAQAVMALAGSTKTIRNVDKIVGPGNTWVQMAKKRVLGLVGIDSIAGPSEVLIIANNKANPAWVAADMLSQAEHNPGSAVLCTESEKLALEVLTELKQQAEKLGRAKETIDCLLKFSAIVVCKNMADVIFYGNLFATEHLQIQCGKQSKKIAGKIKNAGAIFIGDYSPVAVGDYWAGPSHTLPTGTSARFFSALSANDFVKATSIIEYDKKKLAESAEDIIRLAEAEGLDAHARSVRIRQQE